MKPRGYWTKEKCQEEALKYKSRIYFKLNAKSAYNYAVRNKCLDEICSHMLNKSWTKEKCQEEALKYNTRSEFKLNANSAYNYAVKNKYLDDICSHIINVKFPNKYWTKNKCQEIALLCETKQDFRKKYAGAYKKSIINNWINDICSHMISPHKEKYYWTKEKCHEIALKYEFKVDFQKSHKVAYNTSLQNNWINDICSHMIPCGNLNQRLIYAFIFPDNYIYIGLTCNIKKRQIQHLNEQRKNTSVYKFILKSGTIPKLIKLTDYIDVNEAIKLEQYYITLYKNEGYNLINKVKGGGIGYGGKSWDHKKRISKNIIN